MASDPYAAVYADPDDDGAREEVAAQGGLRGEFVAIQLARARGEKIPKPSATAEKQLLKEHVDVWLEPFDQCLVASTVKWERGFPVAAKMNLGGRWTRKRSLAHVPALATLQRLDLGQPNKELGEHIVEGILALPALHHLRELKALPANMLAELARAKAPYALEVIVCRLDSSGGEEREADEKRERAALDKAMAIGTGLPALADLKLAWGFGAHGPASYAWFFDSEVGRRLQALRIHMSDFARPLVRWFAALAKAGDAVKLSTLELSGGDWELFLERTAGGWRLVGDFTKVRWSSPETELRQALPHLQLTEMDVKGF